MTWASRSLIDAGASAVPGGERKRCVAVRLLRLRSLGLQACAGSQRGLLVVL